MGLLFEGPGKFLGRGGGISYPENEWYIQFLFAWAYFYKHSIEPLILFLIIEAATEKVSQFIIPLKSIDNKNQVF